MCEGKERRRKEVLHGGGGKPVAFLGLSAYRKDQGDRRAVLLMFSVSRGCCCFAEPHSYFLQATLE